MVCRYHSSVVNLAVFVAGTNRVVISNLLVNKRTVVCNNFCIVNLTQTMFFDLAGIDVCLLATVTLPFHSYGHILRNINTSH